MKPTWNICKHCSNCIIVQQAVFSSKTEEKQMIRHISAQDWDGEEPIFRNPLKKQNLYFVCRFEIDNNIFLNEMKECSYYLEHLLENQNRC